MLELVIAFITGVVSPVIVLLLKSRLDKKNKPDMVEEALRVSELVTNKIELADLTAASHISCLDYLGDIPWEKFPEIKLWYSRIKSRPSFRSILTDKIVGIPPRGNYALLDF